MAKTSKYLLNEAIIAHDSLGFPVSYSVAILPFSSSFNRVCVNHPGSKRFKLIIDSYCDRYTNALTKYDKMGVTKELFDGLRMTSRFLKYNKKEKAWEEISALAARDK